MTKKVDSVIKGKGYFLSHINRKKIIYFLDVFKQYNSQLSYFECLNVKREHNKHMSD